MLTEEIVEMLRFAAQILLFALLLVYLAACTALSIGLLIRSVWQQFKSIGSIFQNTVRKKKTGGGFEREDFNKFRGRKEIVCNG